MKRVLLLLTSVMSQLMSCIKFPWHLFKLIYLHLEYIFLGLDQEYFNIHSGNCFYKIGCYKLALGNYQKALEEGDSDALLRGAIGDCHTMLGNKAKALLKYREAYKTSNDPNVVLGLICAELNNGNVDEGQSLIQKLSKKQGELSLYHIRELERIKQQLVTLPLLVP